MKTDQASHESADPQQYEDNNNNNWKKLSDGLMVSIPSRSQSQVPAGSPKKNVTTDDGTEPIYSPVAQPKVKPVIQYSPAAVAVAKQKDARSATKEPEKKPAAQDIRERFSLEVKTYIFVIFEVIVNVKWNFRLGPSSARPCMHRIIRGLPRIAYFYCKDFQRLCYDKKCTIR